PDGGERMRIAWSGYGTSETNRIIKTISFRREIKCSGRDPRRGVRLRKSSAAEEAVISLGALRMSRCPRNCLGAVRRSLDFRFPAWLKCHEARDHQAHRC